MSIRTRIFHTFLSLIFISIIYLIMFFFIGYLRVIIDSDRVRVYELKNTWNEVLISMNNITINWSNGHSYELFLEKSKVFNKEVIFLSNRIESRYFYSKKLKTRILALLNIWKMAQSNINQIISSIENQNFKKIIRKTEFSPGLQRLNHLWIELLYNGNEEESKEAYAIKQVIDAIEFFPIYSDTVNNLFNFILEDTNLINSIFNQIQKILSIFFIFIFFVSTLFFSYVSTKSITEPIINSILKLTKFMGKTIEKIEYTHTDELKLLSNAVSTLTNHYTNLSDVANKLANGDIDGRIEIFSKQDIVGNALKKVSKYLNELAKVSKWIKNGKYGSEIKVKSDKDVLAKSFNIMSNVIDEKITTMTNMFEAVEEGIIVFDEDLKIIEANSKLLKIAGINSIQELNEKNISSFIQEEEKLLKKCFSDNIKVENYYTSLVNQSNIKIPIRVTARKMPVEKDQKKKVMFFIVNESWKIRAKKQRNKLRAQAAIAGLKALRAQINPHFLFNTLNTIAQLIESDSESAVNIIEKLADLFRYSLATTKRDMVKMSEELEHIKKFLEIEKLRFHDRLEINFNIDNKAMEEQMPPMLLQPIVENAVRYGKGSDGRINLFINFKKNKDNIIISIADNGKKQMKIEDLLSGHGIGLKNVNHRLKTLYQRKLYFNFNKPSGLIVSMKIPAGIK